MYKRLSEPALFCNENEEEDSSGHCEYQRDCTARRESKERSKAHVEEHQ